MLYFTRLDKIPEAIQSVVSDQRKKGIPIQILAIGSLQPVAGADVTIPDAAGQVELRYGISHEGAAYLLRPDQHVCARWLSLDAQRLEAALQYALPH